MQCGVAVNGVISVSPECLAFGLPLGVLCALLLLSPKGSGVLERLTVSPRLRFCCFPVQQQQQQPRSVWGCVACVCRITFSVWLKFPFE
uniref:Putative secreted protein n=1 Tax=Anopheles marajoara TaxID=58244 RepID=A0A2M4CA63_9DIPT